MLHRIKTIILKKYNFSEIAFWRLIEFIFFVFILAFANNKGFSHTINGNIEIITTEKGLSQGTANCIIQDSRGYIWIGTNDGLNQYDAYSFKVFKHSYTNNSSISNNHILKIYEDNAGNIWIGTMGGGLSKYNATDDNFENTYFLTHNRYKGGSNIIKAITADDDGIVWVGSWGGGLLRYNPATKSYLHFIKNPVSKNVIKSNFINTICHFKNEFLLIGTTNGLQKFDIVTGCFTDLTAHFIAKGLSCQNITQITPSKLKPTEFLIGNDTGQIFIMDVKNGLIKNVTEQIIQLQKNDFSPIIQYYYNGSDSLIFFNIYKKLFVFNFNKNTLIEKKFPHSELLDYMFQSLKSLFIDNSNNIWIGSNGAGVCMLPPVRKNFNTLFAETINSKNPVKSIRSIIEDDEFIWAGGYVGFTKYNKLTGKSTFFLDKKSQYNANIYTIIANKNSDFFWLGTECGGLLKFNKKTGSIKPVLSIKNNTCIYSFSETSNNNIWLGSLNNIYLFNKKTEKIQETLQIKNNENGIKNIDIKIFALLDDDSVLWIGTDNSGLFLYNKKEKKFESFEYNPAIIGSIAGNQVNCIIKDSKNNKWLGTSGGLCFYEPTTKKFKKFNSSQGLPNDMIYAIIEDEQANLWLSTNQGICKFNPQNLSTKNYTAQDGIAGNEFNHSAYYKGKDGKIFFGGTQGLTFFQPWQIEENQIIPKIALKSVKKFNQDITLSFYKNKELKFYQQDAVFTFEFVALNYYKPLQNQYAYKIIGLHDDWIKLGNNRTVTITNLNPGKYVLKVIGSNNDNIWNEQGLEIKITVFPPIWKTWWFRLIIVLLLLLSTFIVYRIRLINVTKQKIKLEQLVNERTKELLLSNKRYEAEIEERKKIQMALEKAKLEAENANRGKSEFLANISHEIRTPMNAILGFTDLLYANATDEKNKNYLESIRFSGKSLLKLINDILDLSKIEAGKMEINYKPFHPYLVFKEINQIFSLSIEQKKLDYQFIIAPDFPQYIIFDEIRLRQILFNLIGNAIKFTEKGSIKVEVSCNYHQNQNNVFDMLIKIKDTGIGIPKSAWDSIFEAFRQQDGQNTKKYGGTGLGLSITKRLTEMMSGKIWLESEVNVGSCFYLHFKNIPISEELHPIDTNISLTETPNNFLKPPLVLIASKYPEKRNQIINYLNNYNIAVLAAENSTEIVEITAKELPEIIFIFSEENYFNLKLIKNELQKSLKTLNIPIIAIMEKQENQISEYADGFIYQPIENDNLIELIKYFIPEKNTSFFTNLQNFKPEKQISNDIDNDLLIKAIEKIENDFIPYWEKIINSGFISDIEEFGYSIKKLGTEFNIYFIENYGDKLIKYVTNFDTENMTNHINNFDIFVMELKKMRKEIF